MVDIDRWNPSGRPFPVSFFARKLAIAINRERFIVKSE
jgi:hypothetical protein